MAEDNNNTTKYFRVTGIKLFMPQDAVNNPNDIKAKSYVAGVYTEQSEEKREKKIIDPEWKGLYSLGNIGYIASLSKDPDKFLEYWTYVVTEASAVINSEMNRIVAQEKQSNDSGNVEVEV